MVKFEGLEINSTNYCSLAVLYNGKLDNEVVSTTILTGSIDLEKAKAYFEIDSNWWNTDYVEPIINIYPITMNATFDYYANEDEKIILNAQINEISAGKIIQAYGNKSISFKDNFDIKNSAIYCKSLGKYVLSSMDAKYLLMEDAKSSIELIEYTATPVNGKEPQDISFYPTLLKDNSFNTSYLSNFSNFYIYFSRGTVNYTFIFDTHVDVPNLSTWIIRFGFQGAYDYKDTVVYRLDAGTFELDYTFNASTGIKIRHLYNLAKLDPLILVFSTMLVISIFLKIVWGLMARIYEIVILYILMPAFASTIPFDDGDRFKRWKDNMVQKVLMAYGTLITLNLYFVLLPIIESVTTDFIVWDQIPKTVTNGLGSVFAGGANVISSITASFSSLGMKFGSFIASVGDKFSSIVVASSDLTKTQLIYSTYINKIVYLLFFLVLTTMLNSMPKIIGDLVGGEDLMDKSGKTKDAVDDNVKKVSDYTSGRALTASAKKFRDNALGFLPGGETISKNIDALKGNREKKRQAKRDLKDQEAYDRFMLKHDRPDLTKDPRYHTSAEGSGASSAGTANAENIVEGNAPQNAENIVTDENQAQNAENVAGGTSLRDASVTLIYPEVSEEGYTTERGIYNTDFNNNQFSAMRDKIVEHFKDERTKLDRQGSETDDYNSTINEIQRNEDDAIKFLLQQQKSFGKTGIIDQNFAKDMEDKFGINVKENVEAIQNNELKNKTSTMLFEEVRNNIIANNGLENDEKEKLLKELEHREKLYNSRTESRRGDALNDINNSNLKNFMGDKVIGELKSRVEKKKPKNDVQELKDINDNMLEKCNKRIADLMNTAGTLNDKEKVQLAKDTELQKRLLDRQNKLNKVDRRTGMGANYTGLAKEMREDFMSDLSGEDKKNANKAFDNIINHGWRGQRDQAKENRQERRSASRYKLAHEYKSGRLLSDGKAKKFANKLSKTGNIGTTRKLTDAQIEQIKNVAQDNDIKIEQINNVTRKQAASSWAKNTKIGKSVATASQRRAEGKAILIQEAKNARSTFNQQELARIDAFIANGNSKTKKARIEANESDIKKIEKQLNYLYRRSPNATESIRQLEENKRKLEDMNKILKLTKAELEKLKSQGGTDSRANAERVASTSGSGSTQSGSSSSRNSSNSNNRSNSNSSTSSSSSRQSSESIYRGLSAEQRREVERAIKSDIEKAIRAKDAKIKALEATLKSQIGAEAERIKKAINEAKKVKVVLTQVRQQNAATNKKVNRINNAVQDEARKHRMARYKGDNTDGGTGSGTNNSSGSDSN